MKNGRWNVSWQPSQDNATVDTIQELMSSIITANTGSDNRHGGALINNSGHVTGNGNGSFYFNNFNLNINYHFRGDPVQFSNYPQLPPPRPLLSSSSTSSTASSSTANTNGGLLRILSSSTASSSSFTAYKKRAVLCGVTYRKRKFSLQGTIDDVNNMKSLLLGKFKFPIECIRVLTEEKEPSLIPTKRNILDSLRWLVRDCQSGDSLVFYFSGHGLQQPEYHKGDEIDGLDETLCPVDFMREGMITDNEINSIIVRPLKKGVTLHAILDTCHSGTTLDLMHVYKKEKGSWKWEVNIPTSKEPIVKHPSGGLAICLSACEDNQMAVDTPAFDRKMPNGVMTYLFSKIIREHSEITYGDLLEKIHEEIGTIYQSKFCNSILKRIFHHKLDQDPLLSSSEKFDVSRTKFIL